MVPNMHNSKHLYFKALNLVLSTLVASLPRKAFITTFSFCIQMFQVLALNRLKITHIELWQPMSHFRYFNSKKWRVANRYVSHLNVVYMDTCNIMVAAKHLILHVRTYYNISIICVHYTYYGTHITCYRIIRCIGCQKICDGNHIIYEGSSYHHCLQTYLMLILSVHIYHDNLLYLGDRIEHVI